MDKQSSSYKRMKWTLIGAVVVLGLIFGIMQGLVLTRDYANPPVIQEPDWDSHRTRRLAERACFDCHSNETVWPWYSRLFPMSEMVRQDVEVGREILNFSEWLEERDYVSTEEMVETISKSQMPLPYYPILHPEAQLTEGERGELINGLIATLEEEGEPLQIEELYENEHRGE